MSHSYPFTIDGVGSYAPALGGVYLIGNQAGTVIYVGQSHNIHHRLTKHVSWRSEQATSIFNYGGAQFAYELVPYYLRRTRENQLISHFNPVCNAQ